MTNKELNDRPSSFVTELKTLKGTNYKPNTLYEIIASIQHHLRTNGKFISLRDDADFSDLCVVLDAKMKELSKLGLGINKKTGFLYQQNIIIEQENILWGRNILGPPKKKPRDSDQPSVSHRSIRMRSKRRTCYHKCEIQFGMLENLLCLRSW